MSVRQEEQVIILVGQCQVEDAEPLLAALQAAPGLIVDISGASHLHTAVLQVLVALRPEVRGISPDPFIREWIHPLLQGADLALRPAE
jgi:anti-anti-sigma regulatory factor